MAMSIVDLKIGSIRPLYKGPCYVYQLHHNKTIKSKVLIKKETMQKLLASQQDVDSTSTN